RRAADLARLLRGLAVRPVMSRGGWHSALRARSAHLARTSREIAMDLHFVCCVLAASVGPRLVLSGILLDGRVASSDGASGSRAGRQEAHDECDDSADYRDVEAGVEEICGARVGVLGNSGELVDEQGSNDE